MNISQYLITLLTEKGIDLGYNFKIKSDSVFGDHIIPMMVLVEFIENLDPNSQKKIISDSPQTHLIFLVY